MTRSPTKWPYSGEMAVAVCSSTMEQMAMKFQGLARNMYHEPINDGGVWQNAQTLQVSVQGDHPTGNYRLSLYRMNVLGSG